MIDTNIQTIEPMVEALVREHGLQNVQAALTPIMKNWRHWQRLWDAAKRADAKIKGAA